MVAHIIYAEIEMIIALVSIIMMGFIGTLMSDENNEMGIFYVVISSYFFYSIEIIPVWYFVMVIVGISLYAVQKYKGVVLR